MSKTITLKLTLGGRRIGPFTIVDEFGNIIATDVPKDTLINGVSYIVNDNVTMLTIQSTGLCTSSKTININRAITPVEIANSNFVENNASSLWRHLTDISLYNNYYGATFPYTIEYPMFSYPQDNILQSVKSYDKVYRYLPDSTGVFNNYEKVALDNEYFTSLVIYNDQQSSGVLNLVPKPKNNLKEYSRYPIYNIGSKSILYTKSDNFYQINNFYDIVKDKSKPLFITDCNSLSQDKVPNQSNLEYTNKSFKKSPIRSKDVKLRYILEGKSDIHIVSQILYTSSQVSYK